MTISDKERCKVAEELRELDAADFGCGPIYDCGDIEDVLGLSVCCCAWYEAAGVERLADLIEPQPVNGETSDGYHTFNELYHHRAVLFSVIVAKFADRAWKSKLHADGTMYDGMFIVGVETPDGQATYHYDIDPYWDMFRCKEVDRAPEWDGHTPSQAIERIGKLVDCETDRLTCCNLSSKPADDFLCSVCGEHVDIAYVYNCDDYHANYCPNCGAKVVEEGDRKPKVYTTIYDVIDYEVIPALGEYADCYDVFGIANDCWRYDDKLNRFVKTVDKDGFWNSAVKHEWLRMDE